MAVGIAGCVQQALTLRTVSRKLEGRTAPSKMPRGLGRVAVYDADDRSPQQAPLPCWWWWRDVVNPPWCRRRLVRLEWELTDWGEDHCFACCKPRARLLPS
jgi:hypothetical protein